MHVVHACTPTMATTMATTMCPRAPMCMVQGHNQVNTMPRSTHRYATKTQRRCFTRLETRCAAASTEPSSQSGAKTPVMPLNAAVSILHSIADGATPDVQEVFEAVRAVIKAKPSVDFASEIAGPGEAMRRWQLVYTVKGSELANANAGKPSKLGAYWALLPACLGFAGDGGHENGIYIASGALSFRFEGLYDLQTNKIGFDYGKLTASLGPWKVPFTLKDSVPASYDNPAQAPGFFLMLYADEKVMIARGKSGGVALWIRAKPSWLLV